MEAKRNHLAEAAAKQAALSNQIIQTQECSLLLDKSIEDCFIFPENS